MVMAEALKSKFGQEDLSTFARARGIGEQTGTNNVPVDPREF